jgi:6,7-dimethyl-8-ribityllumazine synthase
MPGKREKTGCDFRRSSGSLSGSTDDCSDDPPAYESNLLPVLRPREGRVGFLRSKNSRRENPMSLASPVLRVQDGAGFRLGLVAARFNEEFVDGLLAGVEARLRAAGVKPAHLTVVRVPGSHEVPWAAQALALTGRFDCVVALGVLIAGATNHHDMVGQSVSHALQRVAIATHVPVINGVIVVNSPAQARARCVGRINRSAEFAGAALEMAALRRRFSR